MAVKNAARPSARERLLAAANELFYEEGVHTVGIDRVIEHAGVAKGSLYNTFGSKDELIHAYLEARHANIAQRITRTVDRYDTPRERLLAVFEAQGALFRRTGLPWLRIRPRQRGIPPRRPGGAGCRGLPRLGARACSPASPRRPASRTRRAWPASSTCSTTAAGCRPAWTTTRPRPRRPAPPPTALLDAALASARR